MTARNPQLGELARLVDSTTEGRTGAFSGLVSPRTNPLACLRIAAAD
jgi:hypothetical protein